LRDEADQQRVDAAPDGAVVLGVDLASGPDQTVTQILESGDPWKAVEHLKQAPFTVYLCGPITGQEVDYTWRAAATAMLQAHGIRTLDPLRGKHRDQICNLGLGYKGQFAAPEIADRDQMDIDDADVILAHFPYDPPRQSIGSLMEIGMAVKAGKTVILCSVVPVFNEHLFCRNFTTLEPNFEQALNRIVAMAMARRR
jgi:nucleoside 2-deoxyribosyltransferase